LTIFNKITNVWCRLVGSEQYLPLTTRIFHSICLICIIALVYNIPLNFFVGLPIVAIISAGSLLLVTAVYLASRIKGYTGPAVFIFCSASVLLFTINYFLNSGIDGPTDLFFVLVMVIMVAVVPVKRYWIAVTCNILILLTLHYIQYQHGLWVSFTYIRKLDRYIDFSSAYVTVVAVILFTFYVIRRNYEIEKKLTEEKTAEMKVLNDENNKLLSIISHDLRAPLSNIQNYLELLSQIDLNTAERAEIEDQLLLSTRGTLDLLNNVLSWSKNQMDGIKFNRKIVDVSELLSSHLLIFQPIAQRKRIILQVEIDPLSKIYSNGDMVQLIIRNLVNNAIKFTAYGGKITVTSSTLGNSCLITVKDSGNGLPAKLSDQIFNLNAESTTGTGNEKGVGLGLVLCKQFTEALGGRIWFNCHANTGMSFFVEFPLLQQESPKPKVSITNNNNSFVTHD
jgi:two-component system sensor histidine kinase/response regulator